MNSIILRTLISFTHQIQPAQNCIQNNFRKGVHSEKYRNNKPKKLIYTKEN